MNKIISALDIKGEVKKWEKLKMDPELVSIPQIAHPSLKTILHQSGVQFLYKHQSKAIKEIWEGQNVAITTGTASGKSICYQIPILQELLGNPKATSMLLYPTKALAQDQFNSFQNYLQLLNTIDKNSLQFFTAVYDGDTPSSNRKSIREKVNILLTNPDMLHIGILPHHTMWANFFKNLKYIVVDELHMYRGVFGSHFANILRRLGRLLNFYGAKPLFILTSATISNAAEFCRQLIGQDVEIVEKDHSPNPARNYLFVNPPFIDQALGIRKGMIDQAIEIAEKMITRDIQTLIFARSRRTVELTLLELRRKLGKKYNLAGYRSGYLKTERRKIEANLREGLSAAVISTNALELGIDMGFVDAVILLGYPGTKTSFFQQTGRAGRRDDQSIAVLVASQSPIDQFIVQNPDFLLTGHTENALIDPDNPIILFNHFKCAAFELPFTPPYSFGDLAEKEVHDFLHTLEGIGLVRKSDHSYYWLESEYPAGSISIRTISNNPIALFRKNPNGEISRIGEVDYQSALKTVHQGAVYLHNGDLYLVRLLSLDSNCAELEAHLEPYFTTPISDVVVDKKEDIKKRDKKLCSFSFGDLDIIEKVKAFRRIDLDSREILGTYELDLPELRLSTKSFWISFQKEFVEELAALNLWTNKSNNYGPDWNETRKKVIHRDNSACQFCGTRLEMNSIHVHHIKPFRTFINEKDANNLDNLISLCGTCHQLAEKNVQIRSGLSGFTYLFSNLAPIHLMCDRNDIGAIYDPNSKWNLNLPEVYIFDQFPGGIGLSVKIFSIAEDILENCLSIITACTCKNGCPSCVGPAGENGKGAKETTRELIKKILFG